MGASVEGRVYRAASGQWAFQVSVGGVDMCGGAGFDDEADAYEAMYERFCEFEEREGV